MKKTTFLFLIGSCFWIGLSFTFSKQPTIYGFDKIEKNWSPIGNQLLASKFEVTNLEYRVFLQSINQTAQWKNQKELLRIHNETWMDSNLNNPYWRNEFPDFEFSKHYHTHPSYHHYPVVNITQAGAKSFCEWLTNAYNKNPKRKYKKVRFRLPSEKEWILAARAGHELAPFPWGGYYVRNGKGEFLANFKGIDQSKVKRDRLSGRIEMAEDDNSIGGSPAPSTSYYSNNFGLYNISGNVAEMLAETGRTKGGSFASSGYYIRIDAEDEYAGFQEPSPFIGFRYFVDIIEE